MSGRALCIAAAAGLIAGLAAGPALAQGCATDEAAARAALNGRYADLKTAMNARDRAAILSVLAPGFVMQEATGETKDADAMIADLMQLPHDPNKVSTTTIGALSLKGSRAQVAQHYHLTTNKTAGDGAPRTVEIDAHSTDTWTCSSGVWRQDSTRTDELEVKVNGQVISHRVRAAP